MLRATSWIGGVCLLVLAARDAAASGFFLTQIGGPDAHPTEAAPTAVFWNPAALGGSGRFEAQADLVSILRSASYTRDLEYQWDSAAQSWRTVTGAEQHASLFNYVPLPFLGASVRAGRRLVLALAGYTPFGASSSWSADGPQRYQSISGSNQTVFISPSAALEIAGGLHLGLTLSYVRSMVQSERKADFSDIVSGLPQDPSLAATMKLSGFAGNAFSATVGAFLDLPRLKVGVAYQPPIRVHNHGRIVLEPEGQKLRDVIGERAAEADAEMSFTLPDNLKASIDFYPRPRLRLRLYGEWVGWSRFDAIRIRVSQRTLSLLPELITEQQRFHDAFGLRLQGKHWLRGQGGERSERGLALFAGLGYDASAVPDETLSTQFVDADKLSLSFGVDLGLGESFRGKLALQYTHFFARTVKGSTRVPSADGRYGAELVMIDLNLAYARQ